VTKPESYRIVVNGTLSDRFESAFAGMAIEADEGRTAIVGTVRDQSHLFGILESIRSLGLELIRVETQCR
jgi:hypothetical protein